MRVLPCLAPSGVHSVQPLASKTRQPISYSSFHSTPSASYTPRPSAILLSPRMLRLNIQLACAQRKRSLRFIAYPMVCLCCLVSVANPVPCSRLTLMLTVKDSKKSTRSIIRWINACSPISTHSFLLSLKRVAYWTTTRLSRLVSNGQWRR
jgi:hypothetical protein